MLNELREIVETAGAEILKVYSSDFSVEEKTDQSPVTAADLNAHAVIVDGLTRLDGSIPILSEEGCLPSYEDRREWRRFWLVDPLDGTREFVKRNGEFTVNIALIEDHKPTIGAVGVPAQGTFYYGDVPSSTALRITAESSVEISTRACDSTDLVIATSRSHHTAREDRLERALRGSFSRVTRQSIGSSLKFCLLAEGRADIYPKLGPTSEWDTAAAHAILVAAGGDVIDLHGTPLVYNKKSIINPFFFAVADTRISWIEFALPEISDPTS